MIENSVQETLLYPLLGRAAAAAHWPMYFTDHHACETIEAMGASNSTRRLGRMTDLVYGLRYEMNVKLAREYLKEHPEATVVNMGAGLDSLYEDIDNGLMTYVSIDYPEVIELRRQYLPLHEREYNVASSLHEEDWMHHLPFDPQKGILFLAAGVFYYFTVEEGKQLIKRLAAYFPEGRLAFDCESPRVMKGSDRAVRKNGIMNAPMPFLIKDPRSIRTWSKDIAEMKIIPGFLSALSDTRLLPFHYRFVLQFMGYFEMMYVLVLDFANRKMTV